MEDMVLKEGLLRTFPIFVFLFFGYGWWWEDSNSSLPIITVVVFPLIISVLTLPPRLWIRRKLRRGKHEKASRSRGFAVVLWVISG